MGVPKILMPEGSGCRCSFFWKEDSGNTEDIFEYNGMMMLLIVLMTSNDLSLVQEMGKISPET
ncbi:hypothetical protein SF123566_6469 [Shigella flexneri 1235-66]|nr:hypothetical protein SF123566_6469 [Shigella flexneri 1235-66]